MDRGFDCGYQIKETRIPRTIFLAVVEVVKEAGQYSVAEWNKLQSMLMRVLAPFPDAEQAVIRGSRRSWALGRDKYTFCAQSCTVREEPIRLESRCAANGIVESQSEARNVELRATVGQIHHHRGYGGAPGVLREDSLTVVLSPTARQSAEFLRKASGFTRKLGIRSRGDGDNEISLLFPNGSRIVGLPGTEGTVRGFSRVSLMLIDEAARVSDDLYKAVRPMLAVGEGDLWLMSTPWGQRGFFWDEWTNHAERWTRVSVKATECPHIPEAFLKEERATMGEWWFRQEYLCEFVD